MFSLNEVCLDPWFQLKKLRKTFKIKIVQKDCGVGKIF
jgi:hypothetical protein